MLPSELDTLAAVHTVINPIVRAAHTIGPLPRVGSVDFIEADYARQLAAVVVLGEAYVIADPEARVAAAMADASSAVCAAMTEHGITVGPSHAELTRRRTRAEHRPGDYPGGPVRWSP